MSTTSISLSELSSKMKEKNAGIIPGKNSEKSSESNVEKLKKKVFYRNISWNDWFCLSATAYKETLPKNSKLPRDFLTSCLLTPVETSILCHIIQYYNSTIDDPFQFIKNRFTKNKYSNDLNSFSTSSSTFFSKNSSARSKSKYNLNLSNSSHIEKSSESCTIEQLNSILHSIVDAIASDVVEPHLFTQIFRKDKIISQLFHNFLLSQYLLQPYNIHPLSYPLLPEKTCFHPLWMEWSSILDTLITSTISPLPSFSHNIFSRASSIFNSTVLTNVSNSSHSLDINSDKSKQFLFTNPLNHQPMKKSLLTLMCNVVFSDIPENQSLLQLAEYASKSEENRIDISKRIPFHSLIKKLLKNETKSKEEFHSLCFLILSLLQSNMNHVNEIKNTYDFSQLPSFLFQDEENQTTRSFIAAILSTSVPYVKSLQVLCSSHDFLIELKNHIPKFSPQLLLWNLILLKRTFDISSADESMFSKESIHIQVAACIFHNSPECRAATIASLSCFMQSNDNLINYQLFLLALLSFIDMSYLVRFQFLLFVIRFATTHKNLFETSTLNHFDFSNQISNLNANLNSHPNNSSINTNTIASLNSVKSINSLNSQNLFGGIVGKWLLIPNYDFSSDFESFAKYVDNVCRQDNIIIHVYSLSLFFLDYFTKDPHPSIRSTALKAKTFLTSDVNSCTSSNPNKLSQTNSPSSSSDISPPYKNNSYSNSISPPFGSPLQQHQTNSSNSTNHSNRLAQINQINNKFDQSHQQNSQPSPNVDNPQILNFKLQTPNNSLNAQDKNDAFLDQTNYRKQNSTSLNEESESSNESSQSCLIFDNDSNALFNISLRTIVMQGQWSLNQTSPHFKTRPRRFSNTCTGCIDIPGIQLQLRARTKEINSQPIEIAYDGDKLNMAVATKSKFIYSLNESLFVQNKVRVSDSTISKIKFLSCYHNISSNESININKNISNKNINININRNLSENHSYNKNEIPNNNSPILSKENQSSLLGISTNDGCMHLWDTSHQEVCATWRCDLSNPTIEIPLYFTENEFHQSLITARGNSGICTWDLRTMKLISEYQIFKDNNMNNNSNINNKEKDHNDKEVSSILMHPSNPNLCIIGYNSGLMTAIDFRIGTFQQNSIFSFSLGEKIIELSTNRNGADFIYGATSNGNIIVWNSTKNLLTTSYASRKYGITRFSSHPLLPLLCYSNIQEEPMISNSQCHIFTRMKQITPNSPFLFHPIHPVITFGTTNEELLSYNIVLSPLK
ncbi:hypothetical protein TRFO_36921 [Tritrichomonas foetus]|uniref:Raptor N-terminal CASPase-like domain-containing protein n=1 Tax=Tritrichomonas foetus TaxID=1144522 RepID=A0A1J4JIE4_9EUKA|nr:hypothetical protein TRFO_36921 [Tritrichomonas foetus]|eukprot:OHS96964.1 hypothetical protein TRFO_36921 [Tritrichomonas foetus]